MLKKRLNYKKVCIPELFRFSVANMGTGNAQLEADAKLAATLDIEEHEENGMMIEW